MWPQCIFYPPSFKTFFTRCELSHIVSERSRPLGMLLNSGATLSVFWRYLCCTTAPLYLRSTARPPGHATGLSSLLHVDSMLSVLALRLFASLGKSRGATLAICDFLFTCTGKWLHSISLSLCLLRSGLNALSRWTVHSRNIILVRCLISHGWGRKLHYSLTVQIVVRNSSPSKNKSH